MVRLYWLGDVLDSTPIATYTAIFMQIGQLFRKISTDKLFRTDRHTDRQTHTHTRQAKNQFSWRFSVSKDRKCAQLNFEFLTVSQYFHSFYEHGSKRLMKIFFGTNKLNSIQTPVIMELRCLKTLLCCKVQLQPRPIISQQSFLYSFFPLKQ